MEGWREGWRDPMVQGVARPLPEAGPYLGQPAARALEANSIYCMWLAASGPAHKAPEPRMGRVRL